MNRSAKCTDTETQRDQLEQILERAATDIGDITSSVLELYYSRYPRGREHFVEQSGGGPVELLEARMVEEALYCMMIWLERPREIQSLLADMVPHHEHLKIPMEYFIGFQIAAIDLLETVILDSEQELKALLSELKTQLTQVIMQSSEQPANRPGATSH